MFKKTILIINLIIISFVPYAQDWNEIYFLENEAHYLEQEFQYEKAIDNYKRILRDVPNHSLIKFYIGKAYLKTDDQKDQAVSFLEEASEDVAKDFDTKSIQETRAPIEALLYLGEAYQYVGRLDDAITAYNKLKGMITPDHELFEKVNHGMQTCENAKRAMQHPKRISKVNQGDLVNDINSNVNPVISGDGNTMVFTTFKKDDIQIYYTTKENNVWTTPKRITDKVSLKFYLVTVSLSYNGDVLYLATNDVERNDIFVSYREGRDWTDADKLDKTINGKKTNEEHAVVTKDGNTIYFTSDREGGLGGVDIYKSTKNEKGKWGDPENLGPKINTKYNEATPFLTLNDKYLFFSSEGHTSIGGFDVFYIDLESKDQAINMGYPINTTGDDLFFVPDNSLTSGYMSIFDETAVGKNDIYKLTILPKINLSGNIKNAETGESIADNTFSISLLDAETNNVIEMKNSSNAKYDFEIEPGKYLLSVTNENFEAFNSEVDIPSDYASSNYNFDAELNPIAVEEEEIVAEVVEEPEVLPEPAQEVEQEIKPVENPEEKLKEFVEKRHEDEKKEEPIVEETKPEPQKEVAKYTPVSRSSSSTTEKVFSVQLMALRKPVDISYFKNVKGVKEKFHEDGYFRYTVGNTQNYSEAVDLKEKMQSAGYSQAFIRVDQVVPKYTIQIMALIIPVETNYFENLSDVNVIKGSDDYYRYTVGAFSDYNEAKQELAKIAELGYKNAFVKKEY